MKILIAESNPAQRTLFQELLTGRGHAVVEATDGEAARHFVDTVSRSFDLAIIRSHLSGVTGLDLLKHVRTKSPTTKILFMKESDDEVIIGLEIVDAVLSKPFSSLEFLSAVQRCLS